jgi:hypothetical protein
LYQEGSPVTAVPPESAPTSNEIGNEMIGASEQPDARDLDSNIANIARVEAVLSTAKGGQWKHRQWRWTLGSNADGDERTGLNVENEKGNCLPELDNQ